MLKSRITMCRRSSTALLFGIGIVGIMSTNLANSRLVTRLGSDRLLVHGTSAAAFSGVVLAIAAWDECRGLWGLAVPLFLFVSAAGLMVANSIAGALASFSEHAGTVSALVGAHPLWQRDYRLGAGRRLRRRHALANGLGNRSRRDRQPALGATASPGPSSSKLSVTTLTLLPSKSICRV